MAFASVFCFDGSRQNFGVALDKLWYRCDRGDLDSHDILLLKKQLFPNGPKLRVDAQRLEPRKTALS
jgi:hypothetical protein